MCRPLYALLPAVRAVFGRSQGVANGILSRAVCLLRHLSLEISRIYAKSKGIFEGVTKEDKE